MIIFFFFFRKRLLVRRGTVGAEKALNQLRGKNGTREKRCVFSRRRNGCVYVDCFEDFQRSTARQHGRRGTITLGYVSCCGDGKGTMHVHIHLNISIKV